MLCPLCRKKTSLPNDGAMGLTKNNLAQIMVELIKRNGSEDKQTLTCQSEHDIRQRAEFICQSCKILICGSCGMMHHRDPKQHQTFPIDEKLKQMEENLRDLLEWGKNEGREQVERKELLELKQQEVTTRFMAVEAAIDRTFAEERKHLEDREKHLKKHLWDMKSSIKTALQKRCNAEEEATPILSDLNCLTEDILEGGAGAVMEMHQEIIDGYQSQKQRVALNDALGSLQRLLEFISDIRFEQESKKEIPMVGRIMSNTGHWTVEQVRFAVHVNCNPSSIIELSNGLMAVGFSMKSDIELFDKSCQRYRPVGPMAVKDMAPLSNNCFLVLDQDGDVSRVSASTNKSDCLLKQGKDLLDKDKPCLIAADASNKLALLYEDRVESYSINEGVPEHTIKLSPDVGDKLHRMHFHGSSDRCIEILMGNDEAVRSFRCKLSESPQVIASDIRLQDKVHIHGRNIGHTVDKEGNLFIAYTQDDEFITIRKYIGGDISKEEIVICDLQVMRDECGSILLASPSPSCLVMSTSKKLSVFKKATVDDFLLEMGLA